jgi:hypothetical protein
MEVLLNANMCHFSMANIATGPRKAFAEVCVDLQNDYGGIMQHLWIDFEFLVHYRKESFPFRFQRKVGGGVFKLTGLRTPVRENVGHYSVRPDFKHLEKLPLDAVPTYALSLIYASTSVLVDKQKRLGGFNASKFRSDFLSSCVAHGFAVGSDAVD